MKALRLHLVGMILLTFSRIGIASASTDPIRVMRTPDEGVQPQIAVDDHVHLVYLKGDPAGCDVYYRRGLPGETNFSFGRCNTTSNTLA